MHSVVSQEFVFLFLWLVLRHYLPVHMSSLYVSLWVCVLLSVSISPSIKFHFDLSGCVFLVCILMGIIHHA